MQGLIRKLADNRTEDSLATHLRRKRFSLFQRLLSRLPRPIKILDVGGTQQFWQTMGFAGQEGLHIVILNLAAEKTASPLFQSVAGDARNVPEFSNREFDVVFSNSVIEHLGTWAGQQAMAREIQRVGQRFFVQTPNRYFPLEPHFLFPFFQFLPLSVRVWLVTHFNVGWYRRIPDQAKAREEVAAIRLLSQREVRRLFPHGTMYREKFFGLTKSFIAYGGWP